MLGRPLLQVVLAAVHCVLRPHLEQKEPVSDVAGGPDAASLEETHTASEVRPHHRQPALPCFVALKPCCDSNLESMHALVFDSLLQGV